MSFSWKKLSAQVTAKRKFNTLVRSLSHGGGMEDWFYITLETNNLRFFHMAIPWDMCAVNVSSLFHRPSSVYGEKSTEEAMAFRRSKESYDNSDCGSYCPFAQMTLYKGGRINTAFHSYEGNFIVVISKNGLVSIIPSQRQSPSGLQVTDQSQEIWKTFITGYFAIMRDYNEAHEE